MRSMSPAESCHVMAPDTLIDANVTLLGIRQLKTLLAIGALAQISPQHGELKSMHTASEARGQGLARLMVRALLDRAREQGLTKISLETGSAVEFLPARALYEAEGFEVCPPFGTYDVDPLSVFMTRNL
jgi:putative acetyltransferase